MGADEARVVLIVGPFGDAATRRIAEAAGSAGFPVAIVGRCEEAAKALEVARPFAMIVKMDAPGAEQACAYFRSQAWLSRVPIFGVAPESTDVAFTELFTWGGDDLVSIASPYPVLRRLRGLPAAPAAPPPAAHGAGAPSLRAVVAGPVATWRSLIGRALHSGGFAVSFAATPEALAEESLADGVRVVVAASDLPGGGAVAALESARQRGSKAPWIVVTPPKGIADAIATIEALGPAATMDAFAPPENILFVVNELLAARGVDKRVSPRLLYGTAVAFRLAGRAEDEVGFTYNVSAGGAYVRTLDPPEPGQEVWLELWPPRSERRVRLAGHVAWRRAFGPVGTSTVPAGFGVKLTEGLSGDLDRWRGGCGAFAESMLRLRVATVAPPAG